MKKLYSMLAMAAVGFSASALEPTEVALNNPSFEEVETTGNHNEIPAGWQVVGSAWYNEDGTASNLASMQDRNKSWTDGRFGFRAGVDMNLEGGTYIMQEILGQQPGTYVLQFDGMVSRNSWQGDNWNDSISEETGLRVQSGFAFICDDYGDPDEEGPDAEGLSAVYVGGQGVVGEKYFSLYRFYVVHTTHEDLDEETGLKVGFGIPTSCILGVGKARLAFDNFHLYHFDTMDTDAVKQYVDDSMAAPVREGYAEDEEGNKIPMSVINSNGNAVINLRGIVGNTPSTLGVSDVTVAPEPEFVGNGKTYNLQGIEVADPTQPGLYIRDGKKFIVK